MSEQQVGWGPRESLNAILQAVRSRHTGGTEKLTALASDEPGNVEVFGHLAIALGFSGRRETAITCFQQIAAEQPTAGPPECNHERSLSLCRVFVSGAQSPHGSPA